MINASKAVDALKIELAAEQEALARIKEEFRRKELAAEEALQETKARLKTLSDMEAKRARAEARAKAKDSKQPHQQWILDYMAANPDSVIYYIDLANIGLAAGVFPPNKKGKLEPTSVQKQVDHFLGDMSRLWDPVPVIRLIKAGRFQWNSMVPIPEHVKHTAQQSLPLQTPVSTPTPAPTPAERETVQIKGGGPFFREVSPEAYGEIVRELLPRYLAEIASTGSVVDTTAFLNIFRNKLRLMGIQFQGKEPIFHQYFFPFCALNGPIECWKRSSSLPFTEVYQLSGTPSPGEDWKLITPLPSANPSQASKQGSR